MKLYEFTLAYQKALDFIEATEDDLTEGQWDVLTRLEGAFNDKIERVGMFARSLTADAEAVKAERQRLAAREKSVARKIAWLKDYLQHSLEATGKDRVAGTILTVALRKAPVSCVVKDLEQVPVTFKQEVHEVKVDRNGIIDHFKSTGEVVAGVDLITDKRTVWIR